MKPIKKYIEAIENKNFNELRSLFPDDDTTATTVRTARRSMNITCMERKLSPCSSVTNSCSVNMRSQNPGF